MNKMALCGAIAAVLAGASAFAQDTIDASTLLKQGMAKAAALKTVRFNMSADMNAQLGERAVQQGLDAEVLLGENNHAFISVSTPNQDAELYSDGKVQTVHWVDDKEYEKMDAPPERGQVLGLLGGDPLRLAPMWVSDYLHNKERLLIEAQALEYAGKEPVPGVEGSAPAHRLKLGYLQYDLNVWLSDAELPLPLRLELDLSKSFAKRAPEGQTYDVKLTMRASDWKLDEPAPAAQFAFSPPEGVTEAQPEEATAEAQMVGKAAPDFTLATLAGGEVKLSELKGKIVMLDFWASWCGPCRMGLPVVSEVAKNYADKGVVFYAVNQREEQPVIQKFLEGMKLDIPVALDADGRASQAFGASAIPYMVIVGPDGNIAKVHRGFSPYLKEQLSNDLDALLEAQAKA